MWRHPSAHAAVGSALFCAVWLLSAARAEAQLFNSYGFDRLEQVITSGHNEAGDEFAYASAIGDFNNDGRSEIAIGGPGEGVGNAPDTSGGVYVMTGSTLGPMDGVYFRQSATSRAGFYANDEAGDRFGWALAVGDFNDDDFDDLAVGGPGEDDGAGAVFVFYGSSSGLTESGARFFRIGHYTSPENSALHVAGNGFGSALAAADFTGDGVDDLAVGAPGDTNAAGAITIFRGQSGAIGSGGGVRDSGFRFRQSDTSANVSNESGDSFGAALAAGRFDTDSAWDLLIGAPGEDLGEGVFSMLSGGTTPQPTSYRRQSHCGGTRDANDVFGAALAAGDLDGNGIDDAVIGAHNDLVSGVRGGSFCVFLGQAGGDTAAAVSSWSGLLRHQGNGANGNAEAGDRMGSSLAIGDFDADGREDLIVGAPGEQPPNVGDDASSPAVTGVYYSFAGQSGGIASGAWTGLESFDWTLEPADGDRFGASLAAGDVDGNGAADLFAGAPGRTTDDGIDAGVGMFVLGSGAAVAQLTHGPLLGAVTSSSARVFVRTSRATRVTLQHRRADQPTDPWASTSVDTSSNADFTHTFALSGLAAGTAYDLRALVAPNVGGAGTLRAQTVLNTLASAPSVVRFVVAADFKGDRRPFVTMRPAGVASPDFALLLGDQIYETQLGETATTTAQYDKKYRDNFGDLPLRQFMATVPTLMIWDDHEIKNDWKGPSNDSRYVSARASYERYQNSHNPAPVRTGTLYYTYRAGTLADFFVLDTRSFRDVTPGLMIGQTQLDDLRAWLNASTARFKFIVTSVPFNDYAREQKTDGSTDDDVWFGYPSGQDAIEQLIRDSGKDGVVLLSGDRHWGAAYRRDIDPTAAQNCVYEIQATPTAAGFRSLPQAGMTSEVLFTYRETSEKGIYGLVDVIDGASPRIDVSFCTQSECMFDLSIGLDEMGPGC